MMATTFCKGHFEKERHFYRVQVFGDLAFDLVRAGEELRRDPVVSRPADSFNFFQCAPVSPDFQPVQQEDEGQEHAKRDCRGCGTCLHPRGCGDRLVLRLRCRRLCSGWGGRVS